MPDSKIPSDAPPPRLCHIIKWPDFDGYGFNLHCGKDRPGQYIGKVDEDSPAETGGLKQNDRIVEVNGVNISNENHKQVVQRIKAVPNETRLLVVSPEADKFYKNLGIVVTGSQDNVEYIKTPLRNLEQSSHDESDAVSKGSSSSSVKHKQSVETTVYTNGKNEAESHSEKGSSAASTPHSNRKSADEIVEMTEDVVIVEEKLEDLKIQSKVVTDKAEKDYSGLNLNMSAKEMREMVAQKKKRDPRKDHVDFKKKYEIIKTM